VLHRLFEPTGFLSQKGLQRVPLSRIGFCFELIDIVRDVLPLDELVHNSPRGLGGLTKAGRAP